MDLRSKLKEMEMQPTAWVEFQNTGWEIELEYSTKSTLAAMLDRSTKTVYKNHQPVEELDNVLFCHQLAKKVKGWRGLTLGLLSTLIPIVIGDDEKTAQVPCTRDNVLALLDEVYGFDIFIRDTITDLSRFAQERQRTLEKN
jgi:hypothetical protein